MIVFVYGTLLKGLCRDQALKTSRCLGPATIKANLYDFGPFPGIRPGNSMVIGELYEVDEITLLKLNDIEGYCIDEPEWSLYIPKHIEATLLATGMTTEAITYFFNQSEQGLPIESGDYRRLILDQQFDFCWLITYGSNMNIERLVSRVGEPAAILKGKLEGFQLRFNKQTQCKTQSTANICHTVGSDLNLEHQNSVNCPAVAYKLSPTQVAELDYYEGTPNHYIRTSIFFTTETGDRPLMQVYIAHPDQLNEHLRPTESYLSHINQGYLNNNFDLTHLDAAKVTT